VPIEIVEGEAAVANVYAQPANVMLYGPPGIGKTTSAISLFCKDGKCSAFAIPCEDGALKTIASLGLPIPSHPKETVKTWGQMVDTIGWLAQPENRGRFTGVVLDGFSPFAANLYREAAASLKGNNKFDIPVMVRNAMFQLRTWFRALGLHCIIVAHALPPTVQDGIFYPGLFEVVPKSIGRILFGEIDTVLRVDYITPGPGQKPIRVFFTGGEIWPQALGPMSVPPPDWRSWLMKNREGCNDAVVPADLGAFLRGRRPAYQGL